MTTTAYSFNDYFPHRKLDRVVGAPTTKTLQTVFKQLRRNARSVNTSLGGGQYGHLFLVLTDDEWAELPDTIPVVEPTDPGPLLIEGVRQNTAALMIRQQQHEDSKKKYERFQALKRTLKNQLVEAFDSVYFDPIRCDQTDMITESIADTMKFLKTTYGEMTVDELEEETANIKQYPFDPTLSIDLLLTKVQTHSEIFNIAGAPMTDRQIVDLAYFIINKTPTYKQYLIDWNKKPMPKTWNDFKGHMRKAYSDLKKVQGLTIKNSSLHTTEVVEELKNHQTELVQQVENRCNEKLVEMINYTAIQNDIIPTNGDETDPNIQSVNASQEINSLKNQLQALTQQLQSFQNMLTTQSKNVRFAASPKFQSAIQPRYNNQNQSRTQPNTSILRSNNNTYQPRVQNQYSQNFNRNGPTKYCWTHGACGHAGTECQNPAQGHQPFATFRNRMNDNNANCIVRNRRRFNNRMQY